MILLKMYIDNIYMFNDFTVDFTFPRKVNNIFVQDECFSCAPNIRYKKVNILMGANAGGKTTFGKVLLAVQNFLLGRNVDVFSKKYFSDRESKINTLFVIGEYLFEYELIFDKLNVVEKIKHIKLYKSYNLNVAKRKIAEVEFSEYKQEVINLADERVPIISKACRKYKINGEALEKFRLEDRKFYFRFSSFLDELPTVKKLDDECLKNMETILKTIDDSVKSISRVYSQDSSTGRTTGEQDFYIRFKNNEQVLVENGDIKNIQGSRLSQGTIEAVQIAYILTNISSYTGTVYLDEQMAYMHTKLSNTFIMLLIERMNPLGQLFITTHDENALDLNIPLHSFTLLARKNDENIRVVHPEETLKKNDRKLIEYVQNDIFDTNPDLDALWEI